MSPLEFGFVTIRKAAEMHGWNYHSLKSWIERNEIPTWKLGNTNVVHLAAIEGYTPRKERQLVKV